MLTRLLLAGIFAGFLIVKPGTAQKHTGSSRTAKHQTVHHGFVIPPSIAMVSTSLPMPCSQENPCYIKDPSLEKPLPRYRRPEWVNIYVAVINALIILFTLISIKKQVSLMESQAKDASKAASEATAIAIATANAALLNAEAVINAERALLLFTVEKDAQMFHVKVVNYGRVPARALEISTPIIATMTLAEFVNRPPDYGDGVGDIQEWLAPMEKWSIATAFPSKDTTLIDQAARNAKVKPEDIETIIYGEVRYFDGISPQPRHSRYCLAYDGSIYPGDGSVMPVGTNEYLECT